MHPVLLQIGSLKIYSYGVFVAIGFLAALWVSGREIARQGLDREKFLDMGFWVVLSAIAGARIFHVLVYWRQYAEAPGEILKLWNGGLVFYGGFIAATAACVVFLRRNRMPFLPVADASSIGIVLGLAFGRLGCTSAGCCFGKPTTLPWAITFTDPACLAPLHVPLHPTQIYESIGGFAIFGFLYATRDRFKTPGMRFWTMLILYGAARAFFEIFRDDPRGFVGPFSESQVVSAVLITYAVVSILRARSKAAPPVSIAQGDRRGGLISVVHHVLEKSQRIRKRSLPAVGSRVPRFPEDRREFSDTGGTHCAGDTAFPSRRMRETMTPLRTSLGNCLRTHLISMPVTRAMRRGCSGSSGKSKKTARVA